MKLSIIASEIETSLLLARLILGRGEGREKRALKKERRWLQKIKCAGL